RPLDDIEGANPPESESGEESEGASGETSGLEPRDVSIHAVDLDHSAAGPRGPALGLDLDRPVGPAADSLARAKERNWPKGVDEPPREILRGEEMRANTPPKRVGGEAEGHEGDPMAKAGPNAGDAGDGWEDPLEELGLD